MNSALLRGTSCNRVSELDPVARMKTKSDLERDLRVDAEGEVVVDDVERQVVFAAVVRRRTLLAPVHLQRPPVHL